MRAYERLLNYVRVHTVSDEASETSPSTMRQFDLARALYEELQELGAEEVRLSDTCYVYAVLPATEGWENRPALGLIAHMDTAPDFCGENVQPVVLPNYDGGDVVLGTSGRVLTPREFPHLKTLAGRTLIHTDGATLLGADDKAGIAEIMTLCERLIKEQIPHGKICIGFTPDEEVGRGPEHFEVEAFGADYAYTMDGGAENEVEYENFNAGKAVVRFQGVSIHPGSSKDRMVNAGLVAMEFNGMLPAGDTPRNTEGYEGFFHLTEMSGCTDHAELSYIIRDHDAGSYDARVKTMEHAAKLINERYGAGTCALTVKEQYRNMAEMIRPHMFLIDNAFEAMKEAGLNPEAVAIRGGTDGARLSFMGLPCPNLGTGGYCYHGPYEHITAEGMDSAVEVLLNIIKRM